MLLRRHSFKVMVPIRVTCFLLWCHNFWNLFFIFSIWISISRVSGGAHTGKKPSFTFGPPTNPTNTDPDGKDEEEIPKIMTPKEETCYSNRYHDLEGMSPE
jgi:hypothetical protein